MKIYIFPILLAFLANFILGISSLYWHIFSDISSISLVIYRIIFSFIFLIVIVIFLSKISQIAQNINFRVLALHSMAAILVSINWGTFIWSSIHGSVLESGLGYLVAPVIVMLIGAIVFGETVYRENIIAVLFISMALMFLMFSKGNLEHWVYWTIGLTWGGYTILKKATPLTAVDGLLFETFALLIIIFIFGFFIGIKDYDISFNILNSNPLLYMCGLVSVTPLIMFSFSAQKLDSYSMGALQFVLPTTQLFVSILFYNQYAPILTYICFGIIWITLLIVSFVKIQRQAKVYNK